MGKIVEGILTSAWLVFQTSADVLLSETCLSFSDLTTAICLSLIKAQLEISRFLLKNWLQKVLQTSAILLL